MNDPGDVVPSAPQAGTVRRSVTGPTGGDFHPVPRRPAAEITYHDQWGFTRANPSPDGVFRIADDPGVTVEADIAAPPERVWELITDIGLPGRFCPEGAGADWVSAPPHGVGSHFRGRNASEELGHPAIKEVLIRLVGGLAWETDCYVAEWDPPKRFAYTPGMDPATTWATWGFDVAPLLGGGTRLGHFFRMGGPAPSGTTLTAQENPGEEEAIITGRLRWVRHNMTLLVQGVKGLAEEGA